MLLTYIFRRTKTNSLDKERADTYRIVESIRVGQQVIQRTLLNLGKGFSVNPAYWPYLSSRITAHFQGVHRHQCELPGAEPTLDESLAQALEAAAEHYSALIAVRLSLPAATDEVVETDYQRIDINQVEANHVRSIGAETLSFHAVRQLQLDEKLTALGFNSVGVAAVLGGLIGRMVSPGSERLPHCLVTKPKRTL